ncbi:MAG: DNA-binding response OmpR family regulator [Candidatus Omnitrophota bacterium]|jgi:DNA-binding response OmpR family regulator
MARILVVDDSEPTRKLLKAMLEKAGFEVLVGSGKEEGFKLYEENDIDLVITDIMMPNIEGIELIMQIRSKVNDAKIIAMSANKEHLTAARNIGAKLTLAKPFNHVQVMNRVNKALGLENKENS